MDRIQRLISESLHVIREARAWYGRLGVLWSMGKDSDDAAFAHTCAALALWRGGGRPLAEASLALPAEAGTLARVPR